MSVRIIAPIASQTTDGHAGAASWPVPTETTEPAGFVSQQFASLPVLGAQAAKSRSHSGRPPETRYARAGGVSIAYQVVGQGSTDIVLAPCWISHLDHLWREPRFARFVERLASLGRVILFDKRGMGMSDPVPATPFPTLEERMEDLLAVLDAVGSERVVLVGMSIGGRLSALFAATHPERTAALITVASSARGSWAPDYPWAPSPEAFEAFVEQLRVEWGGPVAVEAYAPSLAHDVRFRDWWAKCLRSGASPATAIAAARLNAESDVRGTLPTIQAPTLVLHRTGDRVINVAEARYMAERIPNARFVELAGNDHLPYVGDQDAIIDEIGLFLTGVRPAPRLDRALATVAVAQLGDGRGQEDSEDYRALVRDSLRRFRSQATTITPDGVVATFDGPARAIRWAEAIVEGARQVGLRARVGLHTGHIEVRGSEVGGLAVQQATRVAAHGQASDVLVSGTVKALVAGSGIAFDLVADRALEGLPGEWRLFRVRGQAVAVSKPLPVQMVADVTTAPPAAALTSREREVATLLTLGLSNRQIADALVISVATVERHVANIMLKLDFRSRAQVAAWAVEQGLGRAGQRETVAIAASSLGRVPLSTVWRRDGAGDPQVSPQRDVVGLPESEHLAVTELQRFA